MDEAVSLSIDIEEDVQDDFETFAKLYRYGHFAEARTWFDDCFGASSWKESFPLAAELAKCLLEQGDFQALARLSSVARQLFRGSEARLMELLELLADLKRLRAGDDNDQELDKRKMAQDRDFGGKAARILIIEFSFRDERSPGFRDQVGDGTFLELHTQMMSTALHIAHSMKELAIDIPRELEQAPIWLSERHPSDEGPWSLYRHHLTSTLAMRDFASAQGLLTPLLSLLDAAQEKKTFEEFINIVESWSREVRSHFGKGLSANLTSDYVLTMESTWLATAAAIAQHCKLLSAQAATHSSTFSFGYRPRIKEIWKWLSQLRQVLMQLELCDASVVDSRPGLLYNLQVLNTKRLEGHRHTPTYEDDAVASARQQQDLMLERMVEDQRKSTPSTPSTSHKSASFLIGLFCPLVRPESHLRGELHWTVSTFSDLLWQLCLITAQVTTFIGLIPALVIYPGFIAIPVCVSAIFILSKVSTWRQGPATTLSSIAGQGVPESQKERWVFLAGNFTTARIFQSNVDAISLSSSRSVFGIQGRRRGWLVDFLLDYASERLGFPSRQTDLVYEYLKTLSTDPEVHRIVLIAHGAGGIAASQALSKLILRLGWSYSCKIEVYTFGSMAQSMDNPYLSPISTTSLRDPAINEPEAAAPQRAFGTIEHYCNSNDPIANMGIIQGLKQREGQPRGTVFLFEGASGHFFVQHYLNPLLHLRASDAFVSMSSSEGLAQIIPSSSTEKRYSGTEFLRRDEPFWISTPLGRPQTQTRTHKDHSRAEHARLGPLGDASRFLSHISSGGQGSRDGFDTSGIPSSRPSERD